MFIKNLAVALATMTMIGVNNVNAASPEPVSKELSYAASQVAMPTPSKAMTLVYEHADNHQNLHRFSYTTDAQGRVIEKVMFGWNEDARMWIPICRYQVSYGTDVNVLSYGAYDAETGAYSKHATSQSYDASVLGEVICLPRAK